MNQERVNKLAISQYHPLYRQIAESAETKQHCQTIVAQERARGLDPKATMMGVRTLIHEYLQLKAPVPDPKIKPTESASEARRAIDEHHEHQTAHFQALWAHSDVLAVEAMSTKAVKAS
jgi:hypothetical protein